MEIKRLNEKIELGPKAKTRAMLSLGISFALIFAISLISLTYSWVFATDFSDIKGVNIKLADSQGLIMSLNGQVTQSIDINSYLGGSFNTFSLKEASSNNGSDLFLRDSGMYYNDVAGIYDAIDVAEDEVGIIQFREAVEADYNESFIYFNIRLEATGDSRYLFFDAVNSYIKDTDENLIEPIRISFSFIENETTETKIIGNRQEYLGNYSTGAISSVDGVTSVGYTTTQDVESFAGYDGYTAAVFDEAKTLYHLTQGSVVDLVIRIWMEGGDPLCVNSIGGSTLDISLVFDNVSDSEVA